jgi:hypothetical protein
VKQTKTNSKNNDEFLAKRDTILPWFAEYSPYALVTADEIPNPGNLDLALTLNGQEMQHSNTRNLIFSIPFLIAYLTQAMTLEPGDVIATGTPSGTGIAPMTFSTILFTSALSVTSAFMAIALLFRASISLATLLACWTSISLTTTEAPS